MSYKKILTKKHAYGKMVKPLIFFVFMWLVFFISCNNPTNSTDKKDQVSTESAYDRIIETGIIRCGYVSNPPSCMVDPNTKKLTGIVVEAIEFAAKNLGLKVEWTEEVGFGSMIEGIKANRYDMVPCAIWPNAARARHVDFSIPLFYSGVGIYVRQTDNRFVDNIKAIDSKDVIIATMDGEMADTIARTDFPMAKTLQVPQLSEITTMLLNVKNNKADVTFVELFFANEFLKNNPGSIKNITPDKPVRIFPNTIMLKKGEFMLKSMINTSLEELINQGIINKLLDKYEPAPGTFYRLRSPYRTSKD